MAKKAIVLILVFVFVGMAATIGGLVYLLNKPAEQEVEVVDEGIDYTTAKLLNVATDMKVRLKQSGVKPSYLVATVDVTLVDDKAVTQFEPWKNVMMDAILGVLETKTAEELEGGNRASIKEPVLNAIKDIFPKQEDKDKILGVAISQFLIQ